MTLKLNILWILPVLIFISCMQVVSAYDIPVNMTKGTLDVSFPSSQRFAFNESPTVMEFDVTIKNPSSNEMKLYFAERSENIWVVISDLGNVSPHSSINRSFRITFEYAGVTTQTGEYAIISDKLTTKTFKISEVWSDYEEKTRSLLFIMGFVVAPVIGLLMIFIHFAIGRESARRIETARKFGRGGIFNWSECSSIYEKLIFLLSSTLVLVIAVVIVFLLMTYLLLASHPAVEPTLLLQISIISFVAAFFIPIILALLVWYGDVKEREPIRYIAAMFAWGIFAALIAFIINPIVISLFNISTQNVPLVLIVVFGSIIISPVTEEFLKAIGVYVMSYHRQMDNTLDGLAYGFAAGVGFAAVENWFYFISKMDPLAIGIDAWLLSILYRSFFNTIAHGCFTAFVGAFLGMIKARPKVAGYHYLGFLPGLFVAIILHMIFNLSAFFDIVAIKTFRTVILFFNPLLVITVGVGFILLYRFGMMESSKTPIS